jgi:FMN phosphatase YigB (HAD superfamily)
MADIKNVVFDMGGVLMDWDPIKISHALCPNEADAALLRAAVFDSREWGWVDAGAIRPETVAEYAAYRPEVVIVGGGILHAPDPVAAAAAIARQLRAFE